MLPVLVEVQALALAQSQPTFGDVRRTVVLERHARLHRRENADQSLVNGVLYQQASREVLLARRARLQVHDRPITAHRFRERRALEILAGRHDMSLEVQQRHRSPLEEGEHAEVAHERLKRAAKHEAVESGEHGSDKGAETGYEFQNS